MVTPASRPHRTPVRRGRDRELTVDELAARVGVTVRNLRAYSARGLLPAAADGRAHRLLRPRARRPAAAGPRDARRGLLAGDDRAHARLRAAERQLGPPWPCTARCWRPGCRPEPELTTGAELAARAGVPGGPGAGRPAGGARPRPSGSTTAACRVLDPALLTAGLQVVRLGVPPDELIDAQATVNEHVREIAEHLRADVPRHRLAGLRRRRGAAGPARDDVRTRWRGCSRPRRRRCWRRSAPRWPRPSREPSRTVLSRFEAE